MWPALPTSDYYGGSATIHRHRRTARLGIPWTASRMLINALKRDDLDAGYDQPNQLAAGS